ncbi:MAG: ABC transporter ATP-binding protein [Armatimonadetes bacterium]|nr:ABC transporter ATP-binding protein [Armatimonadota bacterium]
MSNTATAEVLTVTDAEVTFSTPGGEVRALDGVSLGLRAGETLAVVGESGCGKTTLARAVLGLQPMSGGSVTVGGVKVGRPRPDQASRIGMVWQDPFASVNPLWQVKKILGEPLALAGASTDLDGLMREVGLDPILATRYPHQLSGGQRQRVAIGRALALRPPLLICDEPTAALDLSIQAQILNLIKDIQRDRGCAVLYISHDLTTVRYLADRVAVMYLGRVVEEGTAEEVFGHPRHTYTKALLDSAPTLDKLGQLPEATKGETPVARGKFVGCRFANRCPLADDHCRQVDPASTQTGSHKVWCHKAD